MTTTLPEPTELADQSQRLAGGRGLLQTSLTPPAGWQRGLAIPFYGCGEPILRDKCIAAEDEAYRPTVADFYSFPIEQGATCSTLSGLDHEAHARGRLEATAEWALGRQLATDQVGTGSPSFADAEVMGAAEDFVQAVGCLEQLAADTGFGSRWVLHTSVKGAAYARRYSMKDSDGFSPSGARWIISPGYPAGTNTVRIWVTGQVWAAVDVPEVHRAVDHRTNDDSAYALSAGIVAFDPCVLGAIDVPVTACPEG